MADAPNIKPVVPENIPSELKQLNQWVVWKSFKVKEDGKFDKVPVDPKAGYRINW